MTAFPRINGKMKPEGTELSTHLREALRMKGELIRDEMEDQTFVLIL